MTQLMMGAPGVQNAIDYYSNKNAGVACGQRQPVTHYDAGFGLKGLWQAGLNPARQFVGNYSVDIYPNADGTISVQLFNVTSFTSFAYGFGPSWDQSTFGPGGNSSQTYNWAQPDPLGGSTRPPGSGAGGSW
jgi:hypothetical protein